MLSPCRIFCVQSLLPWIHVDPRPARPSFTTSCLSSPEFLWSLEYMPERTRCPAFEMSLGAKMLHLFEHDVGRASQRVDMK